MSRDRAGISLGGSEVRDDVDGDAGSDNPPGTMVFPGGIPGFPDYERFVLVDIVEDGIFQRLQSLDDAAGIECAGGFTSIGILKSLHITGVGSLGRRETILGPERFDERRGTLILQGPVPVGGTINALDVFAGALGHQA